MNLTFTLHLSREIFKSIFKRGKQASFGGSMVKENRK